MHESRGVYPANSVERIKNMIPSVEMMMKQRAEYQAGTARTSRSFFSPAWCALMCVIVFAGHAVAQQCPTRPQAEPVCEDCEVKERAPILPGSSFGLDPGLLPVLEEDGLVFDEDDQGPSPRWYCFEPEAQVDPVWRGAPLKKTFEFCNVGTAPMSINIETG